MRKGSITVLVLAIVMGGIAALLARAWLLGQASATNVAPAPSTSTIVVAAVPLPFGSVITEERLAEIRWNADALPSGAFATKQELLKDGRRVALMQIDRNEPVLRAKISERGSLSTLLAGGKRAVSVQVDVVRGVAGIQPDDRVDVVLIRSERGQGVSDLILQNIKVLVIDQSVAQHDTSTSAKVVTLEVSPEEAQKLLLASNVGRLSLILRRQSGEADADAGHRVHERDLGDTPPVEAPASSSTVVIMRGAQRQEIPVKRY